MCFLWEPECANINGRWSKESGIATIVQEVGECSGEAISEGWTFTVNGLDVTIDQHPDITATIEYGNKLPWSNDLTWHRGINIFFVFLEKKSFVLSPAVNRFEKSELFTTSITISYR